MIEIKHIGKSADDLRFFILLDGHHAGGITVHSVNPPQYSYGIAISKEMRRKGAAKAALSQLLRKWLAAALQRPLYRLRRIIRLRLHCMQRLSLNR